MHIPGQRPHSQHTRQNTLADSDRYHRMGLLVLPDLRGEPVVPTAGAHVTLRRTILHLHFEVHLDGNRRPARC